MKKIIQLMCFLALISALSGFALSLVNNQTAPIIEANGSSAETAYLAEIFPNASFKEQDESGEYVKKSYTCDDGVVYKVETQGYKGVISFLIGIDNDGQYVGYIVLDASSETSGIGSQVGEEDFTNAVLESSVDDEVDTISGATISSSAVVRGLEEANELYQSR